MESLSAGQGRNRKVIESMVVKADRQLAMQ